MKYFSDCPKSQNITIFVKLTSKVKVSQYLTKAITTKILQDIFKTIPLLLKSRFYVKMNVISLKILQLLLKYFRNQAITLNTVITFEILSLLPKYCQCLQNIVISLKIMSFSQNNAINFIITRLNYK